MMLAALLLCKGLVSVLSHHFEATVPKERVRLVRVGLGLLRGVLVAGSLPSRSVMFILVIDSQGLVHGGVLIGRFSHPAVSVVRVGQRLVSETTTLETSTVTRYGRFLTECHRYQTRLRDTLLGRFLRFLGTILTSTCPWQLLAESPSGMESCRRLLVHRSKEAGLELLS